MSRTRPAFELYDTLRILRTHVWLVVLTVLAATVSATGLVRLRHGPPVYSATATLVLNPNLPNRAMVTSDPALSARSAPIDLPTLVGTYNAYVADPGFAALAIRGAHLAISSARLAAETTTALLPGTLLYTITVADDDGQLALKAATALARQFLDDDAAAARRSQATTPLPPLVSRLATLSADYYNAQVSGLEREWLAVLGNHHLGRAQQARRVGLLLDEMGTVRQDAAHARDLLTPPGLHVAPSTLAGAMPEVGQTTASFLGASRPTVLPRSALLANIVLLAALGGLIVGLALALVREYLDSSLRTADEATETLALPVLATIGLFRLRRRGRMSRWGGRDPHETVARGEALIIVSDPFHPVSEAFRGLRTAILFVGAVRKARSLVVTSAVPGEGTSVVAANLAVAMAQAGERVILVDANLRRPILHTFFNLPGDDGLSSLYLIDADDLPTRLASILRQTRVPNLRLLDAGALAPNPAELLATPRTAAIVASLKEQADVLVFDTPAMGLLTDALLLAALVDGTILVARAHTTRRDLVAACVRRLGAVDARVLGLVLNMVNGSATRHGGYRRARSRPPAAGGTGVASGTTAALSAEGLGPDAGR